MSRIQVRILKFVAAYHETNGYPPTLSEISGEVGLKGRASAHHHLKVLEADGYVEARPCRGKTAYYPLVEAE